MDENEILLSLQDFLRKRPVILAGSGLTIPLGLPSMGALAEELDKNLSADATHQEEWSKYSEDVKLGLEAALLKHQVSDAILKSIIDITGDFIDGKDKATADNLFRQEKLPAIAELLRFLTKSTGRNNPEVIVITPNYDRVIERACDTIQVACETGFCGSYIKIFDREALDRMVFTRYNTAIKRVKLFKPHGSLDWYYFNGKSIEVSTLPAPADDDQVHRIMITPGRSKYASSLMDEVMNFHRERMNHHVRRAEALLVIGYGFNDAHLQGELNNRLREGVECVILTRSLDEKHIANLPRHGKWTLIVSTEGGKSRVLTPDYDSEVSGNLWSLDEFFKKTIL